MTRQERTRLRRKRSKIIAFSLLGCMLLFLTGVLITYDAMLKVMGLRRSGSIFSFQNAGQALKDIAGEFPVRRFAEAAKGFGMLAQKLLERLRDMLAAATNS